MKEINKGKEREGNEESHSILLLPSPEPDREVRMGGKDTNEGREQLTASITHSLDSSPWQHALPFHSLSYPILSPIQKSYVGIGKDGGIRHVESC